MVAPLSISDSRWLSCARWSFVIASKARQSLIPHFDYFGTVISRNDGGHRHSKHFEEESVNILAGALTVNLNMRRYRIGAQIKRGNSLAIVAAVVLLLTSSCTGVFITSLEAEAEWVAPLDGIKVTCVVSGSDGGGLSYEWSTTGGSISDTGPVVNWIAPEDVGMYDIVVVVSDSEDRKDDASITLIASNGPPPIIEDLIVTAEHKYLKESSAGYKVAKAYDYTIECVASANASGEMTYQWSCTGGEILGEGSIIAWTAPDMVIDVTVTAKVFDALGNWVRKSIVLEVVVCSDCTF